MTQVTPQAFEISPEQVPSLKQEPEGGELSGYLEQAGLVYFPTSPVELPSPEDVLFLRDVTPEYHKRKNISYYPTAKRVNGMGGTQELRDRAARILSGHHERVEAFLTQVLPTFAKNWTSGTCSLRAFEEKDRAIDERKKSDLVHIDAGAYGATRGDSILRFLTNIDPEGERVWRVKGTVNELVDRYGEELGMRDQQLLREGPLDKLRHGLVSGLSTIYPLARSLDSSPYDRAMRRIHNHMKADREFQSSPDGAAELRFRSGSAWIVFADRTGHSCTSGRLCLIDTFIIRQASFQHGELSPYEILRRFSAGSNS